MSPLLDYLQLCWFKNNPMDLHPSRVFLWKSVGFYLISGIIIEANISDPADATLEVVMMAMVALALLSTQIFSTKKSSVLYQLLTAVFVCENFIVTLGIGVEIFDAHVQGTELEPYPLILGGLLIVWYLAIIGYIFRRVFAFRWQSCVGLALFYFAMTYGAPFMVMEVL